MEQTLPPDEDAESAQSCSCVAQGLLAAFGGLAMTPTKKVKFVDLGRLHAPIAEQLNQAALRVLREQRYIQGPDVSEFEREMAGTLDGAPVCGVSCATFGLLAALKALGIGLGDEVITTPLTAIATAEAISMTGATVVFADLEPNGFCLDPEDVRRKITPRTRAIIPVHIYGLPADLDALQEIARTHGLKLIEDCAQAQGARHRGRRVGTIGDAGVYSFFPSKNLGGFGDGGAVTARDPEVFCRMRMLANHGRKSKYDHELIGMNSRLDTLQAALLRVCLPLLDQWNAARLAGAKIYDRLLGEIAPVQTAPARPNTDPVYHLYVVRVPDRQALADDLRGRGIETGLHYPLSLNETGAYRHLGCRLPWAEETCRTVLSLPMHPCLTEEEIRMVCSAIADFFRQHGADAARS